MNYSSILAKSPLDTVINEEAVFIKQLLGDFSGGVREFVLFYIYVSKKYNSAPVSVGRNYHHHYWCWAKQFKRSSVKTLCTAHKCSLRRKQTHMSSYKCSMPKAIYTKKTLDSLCGLHAVYSSFLQPHVITSSTLVAPFCRALRWRPAPLAGQIQSSQHLSVQSGSTEMHIARMTVLKSKLILHPRGERIVNNISSWWNVWLIFREGLSFLSFFILFYFISFVYRFSSEFSSRKFKDVRMKGKKILCQTKETGKMLYLLLLFMTCYKER